MAVITRSITKYNSRPVRKTRPVTKFTYDVDYIRGKKVRKIKPVQVVSPVTKTTKNKKAPKTKNPPKANTPKRTKKPKFIPSYKNPFHNSLKTTITKSGKSLLDRVQKDTSPKTNRIRVIVLIDETGSMSCHKNATIDAFNAWLDNQKQIVNKDEKELPAYSYLCFHSYKNLNFTEKNTIQAAPNLTMANYKPGGLTNLQDALGEAMDKYSHEDNNIVFLITDGHENASKNYTQADVKQLVEYYRQHKKWLFTYYGCYSSKTVGPKYGFDVDFCEDYKASQTGIQNAWGNLQGNMHQQRGYQQYQQTTSSPMNFNAYQVKNSQ